MKPWFDEIVEIRKYYKIIKDKVPNLGNELEQLIKTEDDNVALLYSRRCLEVIITELCERELKRPRKTEPLKGIIDKLNKEETVPSYIITSMLNLNSISTYGTHPKEFSPHQVRTVLISLIIIIEWYLKYENIELAKTTYEKEKEPGMLPLEDKAKKEEKKQTIAKVIENEDSNNINEIVDKTITYDNVLEKIGEKSINMLDSSSENKFNQEIKKLDLNENLVMQIAYSQLLIKNDIIHITFKRSDNILNLMNNLSKKIQQDSDEIFNINQGGGEITIVCEANKERLFDHLLIEALEIRRKTAVIRIQEAKLKGIKPSIDVPGLYAFFISLISNNNINILDLISTRTQLTFIVS